MAILVGVDEAGYGPVLGPLVITAVVFEVKDHEVDGNLWQILKGAVVRPGSIRLRRTTPGEGVNLPQADQSALGGLAVADSKRLYSSRRGLRRLEEGILAFQGVVSASGGLVRLRQIENLRVLLEVLHCYDESLPQLYPWYQDMELGLPLAAPLEEVTYYRELLKGILTSRGIRFLGARAIAVSPHEFNKMVESCGNKALLLFGSCAKLIGSLWREYPQLEVLCDKHGGRNRYVALLSRAFSRSSINILSEGPDVSSYELRDGTKRLRVSFILKAEDKHLPVALASMYSKYLRELFLKLFNKYWQERLPGLRPTAGYPKDARRFLRDIDRMKSSLRISDEILIRNR